MDQNQFESQIWCFINKIIKNYEEKEKKKENENYIYIYIYLYIYIYIPIMYIYIYILSDEITDKWYR